MEIPQGVDQNQFAEAFVVQLNRAVVNKDGKREAELRNFLAMFGQAGKFQSAAEAGETQEEKFVGSAMWALTGLCISERITDLKLPLMEDYRIPSDFLEWITQAGKEYFKIGELGEDKMKAGIDIVTSRLEDKQLLRGVSGELTTVMVMSKHRCEACLNNSKLIKGERDKVNEAGRSLKALNEFTRGCWQALIDDEHSLHEQVVQALGYPSFREMLIKRLWGESTVGSKFNTVTMIKTLETLVESDQESQDLVASLISEINKDVDRNSIQICRSDSIPETLRAGMDINQEEDWRWIGLVREPVSVRKRGDLFDYQRGSRYWGSMELDLSAAGFQQLNRDGFTCFGLEIKPTEGHKNGDIVPIHEVTLMLLVKNNEGLRNNFIRIIVDDQAPVNLTTVLLDPENVSGGLYAFAAKELAPHKADFLEMTRAESEQTLDRSTSGGMSVIRSVGNKGPTYQERGINKREKVDEVKEFVELPDVATRNEGELKWKIVDLNELDMSPEDRKVAEELVEVWKKGGGNSGIFNIRGLHDKGRVLIRLRQGDKRVFLQGQEDGRLKVCYVMHHKDTNGYKQYLANPKDIYPYRSKSVD